MHEFVFGDAYQFELGCQCTKKNSRLWHPEIYIFLNINDDILTTYST